MLFAEQQKHERQLIAEFAAAARAGDRERFCKTFGPLELILDGWQRAFRAVAKVSAPDEFRALFTEVWVHHGDSIRSDVDSDRDLIAGLRALLVPYHGPAPLTVYRGDSFYNRRRRSHGLSWTTDPEVARGFANGIWRTFTGGSVVVRTDAPADAIISVPGSAEDEVIIDRRRLGSIDVIERLAQQLPPGDLAEDLSHPGALCPPPPKAARR